MDGKLLKNATKLYNSATPAGKTYLMETMAMADIFPEETLKMLSGDQKAVTDNEKVVQQRLLKMSERNNQADRNPINQFMLGNEVKNELVKNQHSMLGDLFAVMQKSFANSNLEIEQSNVQELIPEMLDMVSLPNDEDYPYPNDIGIGEEETEFIPPYDDSFDNNHNIDPYEQHNDDISEKLDKENKDLKDTNVITGQDIESINVSTYSQLSTAGKLYMMTSSEYGSENYDDYQKRLNSSLNEKSEYYNRPLLNIYDAANLPEFSEQQSIDDLFKNNDSQLQSDLADGTLLNQLKQTQKQHDTAIINGLDMYDSLSKTGRQYVDMYLNKSGYGEKYLNKDKNQLLLKKLSTGFKINKNGESKKIGEPMNEDELNAVHQFLDIGDVKQITFNGDFRNAIQNYRWNPEFRNTNSEEVTKNLFSSMNASEQQYLFSRLDDEHRLDINKDMANLRMNQVEHVNNYLVMPINQERLQDGDALKQVERLKSNQDNLLMQADDLYNGLSKNGQKYFDDNVTLSDIYQSQFTRKAKISKDLSNPSLQTEDDEVAKVDAFMEDYKNLSILQQGILKENWKDTHPEVNDDIVSNPDQIKMTNQAFSLYEDLTVEEKEYMKASLLDASVDYDKYVKDHTGNNSNEVQRNEKIDDLLTQPILKPVVSTGLLKQAIEDVSLKLDDDVKKGLEFNANLSSRGQQYLQMHVKKASFDMDYMSNEYTKSFFDHYVNGEQQSRNDNQWHKTKEPLDTEEVKMVHNFMENSSNRSMLLHGHFLNALENVRHGRSNQFDEKDTKYNQLLSLYEELPFESQQYLIASLKDAEANYDDYLVRNKEANQVNPTRDNTLNARTKSNKFDRRKIDALISDNELKATIISGTAMQAVTAKNQALNDNITEAMEFNRSLSKQAQSYFRIAVQKASFDINYKDNEYTTDYLNHLAKGEAQSKNDNQWHKVKDPLDVDELEAINAFMDADKNQSMIQHGRLYDSMRKASQPDVQAELNNPEEKAISLYASLSDEGKFYMLKNLESENANHNAYASRLWAMNNGGTKDFKGNRVIDLNGNPDKIEIPVAQLDHLINRADEDMVNVFMTENIQTNALKSGDVAKSVAKYERHRAMGIKQGMSIYRSLTPTGQKYFLANVNKSSMDINYLNNQTTRDYLDNLANGKQKSKNDEVLRTVGEPMPESDKRKVDEFLNDEDNKKLLSHSDLSNRMKKYNQREQESKESRIHDLSEQNHKSSKKNHHSALESIVAGGSIGGFKSYIQRQNQNQQAYGQKTLSRDARTR